MCKGHIYSAAAIFFCLVTIIYGKTVYFLVAEANEPVHNDSYVLPLTEPSDIAHARDLIAYGPSAGQSIVVASVACGSDCINRDYLGVYKQAWYWRVANFVSFSDSQPSNTYNTPVSVNWNCTNGKQIACPTYTVVYELGTDPKHWERDFDEDDDIDFNDYDYLGDSWINNCAEPDWCDGMDMDHSGIVDFNDFGIFAEAWLSPYASAPMPSDNYWRFACWAWKYQCYGDADNKTEGLQKYRVYMSDMNLYNTAWTVCHGKFGGGWPCPWGTTGYNACVDFNRDYRIYDDDLAILEANFQKKDTQLGPACPPSLICQP